MRQNRKLTIFLGVLLVGIWGSVGLRIVDELNGTDEPSLEADGFSSVNIRQEHFAYDAGSRDPFRYHEEVKRKSVSTLPSLRIVASAKLPPPFRLTGTILNRTSRTAILEDGSGNVQFVRTGDSLAGLRIEDIGEKKVAYRFEGNRGEWKLE